MMYPLPVNQGRFHFIIDDSKTRLKIFDRQNQEIASFACRIIGPSFIDKIKEFVFTLFNWKWIHVKGLKFWANIPEDSNIIINVNSLAKRLVLNKISIYQWNALDLIDGEQRQYFQIDGAIGRLLDEDRKIKFLRDFVPKIKQEPVNNAVIIEKLVKLYQCPFETSNPIYDADGNLISINVKEVKWIEIYYNLDDGQYSIGLIGLENREGPHSYGANPPIGHPLYRINAMVYKEDDNFFFQLKGLTAISKKLGVSAKSVPPEVEKEIKTRLAPKSCDSSF